MRAAPSEVVILAASALYTAFIPGEFIVTGAFVAERGVLTLAFMLALCLAPIGLNIP